MKTSQKSDTLTRVLHDTSAITMKDLMISGQNSTNLSQLEELSDQVKLELSHFHLKTACNSRFLTSLLLLSVISTSSP